MNRSPARSLRSARLNFSHAPSGDSRAPSLRSCARFKSFGAPRLRTSFDASLGDVKMILAQFSR